MAATVVNNAKNGVNFFGNINVTIFDCFRNFNDSEPKRDFIINFFIPSL